MLVLHVEPLNWGVFVTFSYFTLYKSTAAPVVVKMFDIIFFQEVAVGLSKLRCAVEFVLTPVCVCVYARVCAYVCVNTCVCVFCVDWDLFLDG